MGDRRDIDYDHLEDLARAVLGTRVVDAKGCLTYLGHRLSVGRELAGIRVGLVLTLEGAEALLDGVLLGRFDYWTHMKAYAESRGD